jgi:CheY-like chemotaxis protein
MDMMMPKMDGLTVRNIIKNDPLIKGYSHLNGYGYRFGNLISDSASKWARTAKRPNHPYQGITRQNRRGTSESVTQNNLRESKLHLNNST